MGMLFRIYAKICIIKGYGASFYKQFLYVIFKEPWQYPKLMIAFGISCTYWVLLFYLRIGLEEYI